MTNRQENFTQNQFIYPFNPNTNSNNFTQHNLPSANLFNHNSNLFSHNNNLINNQNNFLSQNDTSNNLLNHNNTTSNLFNHNNTASNLFNHNNTANNLFNSHSTNPSLFYPNSTTNNLFRNHEGADSQAKNQNFCFTQPQFGGSLFISQRMQVLPLQQLAQMHYYANYHLTQFHNCQKLIQWHMRSNVARSEFSFPMRNQLEQDLQANNINQLQQRKVHTVASSFGQIENKDKKQIKQSTVKLKDKLQNIKSKSQKQDKAQNNLDLTINDTIKTQQNLVRKKRKYTKRITNQSKQLNNDQNINQTKYSHNKRGRKKAQNSSISISKKKKKELKIIRKNADKKSQKTQESEHSIQQTRPFRDFLGQKKTRRTRKDKMAKIMIGSHYQADLPVFRFELQETKRKIKQQKKIQLLRRKLYPQDIQKQKQKQKLLVNQTYEDTLDLNNNGQQSIEFKQVQDDKIQQNQNQSQINSQQVHENQNNQSFSKQKNNLQLQKQSKNNQNVLIQNRKQNDNDNNLKNNEIDEKQLIENKIQQNSKHCQQDKVLKGQKQVQCNKNEIYNFGNRDTQVNAQRQGLYVQQLKQGEQYQNRIKYCRDEQNKLSRAISLNQLSLKGLLLLQEIAECKDQQKQTKA